MSAEELGQCLEPTVQAFELPHRLCEQRQMTPGSRDAVYDSCCFAISLGPLTTGILFLPCTGSFLRHCPGNAGQAQLDGENRPTLRRPGLVLRAWSWSTEGSAGIGPLCDTRLQKQPCPLPKLSFLLSSYLPSDFLGFQYCGHECSSQCQPEASHTAGGTQ